MYSICKGVNVITNEHHASFLQLNLMSGEIRTHKTKSCQNLQEIMSAKNKKSEKESRKCSSFDSGRSRLLACIIKASLQFKLWTKTHSCPAGPGQPWIIFKPFGLEEAVRHYTEVLSLSLSPSRTSEVTMATLTAPFQYSMLGSNQLKHTIP